MRSEYQTYERHRALIFDSGVGGLSVVGEIRKRLPDLALDYVADDQFRPYGEKSEVELIDRLPGLLASLAQMTSPDCIVIACNTASVTALEAIRAEINVPVIGGRPSDKTRSGFVSNRNDWRAWNARNRPPEIRGQPYSAFCRKLPSGLARVGQSCGNGGAEAGGRSA